MATSDYEIVVGAKDQATRILEQVSGQTRALTRNIQTMSKRTERSTEKMDRAFKGLKATLKPLLAAFAAVKVTTAGFRVVSNAAEAFDTQREAVRGLTQALELNGDAMGPTVEQHAAFASQLQDLANVGDEVTLGLMKQASMLGINNEQLQDATRAAIGMSEATGASLEDSLRKVNETIHGNTEAFAEFLPQLRQAKTDEEKLAIVLAASEKGLAQKASRANEAAGSAERLSNTWGDFLEVVGESLAPVRVFINNGLSALIEKIQGELIPVLAFAETIITNFGKVWEFIKLKINLAMTGIVEDVKHTFITTIPTYLNWFAENWLNIITDVFNGTVTVIKNAMTNAADIIRAVVEAIRNGLQGGIGGLMNEIGEIAGRSLLEGFEAQTKALPEIAMRNLTAGEQEMKSRLAQLAVEIGSEYQRNLAERLTADGGANGLGNLALQLGGSKPKGGSEKDQTTGVESRLLTRGQTQNGPREMRKLVENIARNVKRVADNTDTDTSQSDDTFRVELVK
ncbi:hypothetical protein FYK55_10240 [Roseiconus nitratireducens]|uniref:Tape measure domain-containing protein n=1 Tax=Roseiconus nitratireducens TaxID=2605748 RepID=A0A5M6DEH3_9BACT|nr:hypothetical protein [Roseiconus nitratireducens]KAA5543585.1 hypothetical protein FYK55_10240 [Roseiconus nitratireducens]